MSQDAKPKVVLFNHLAKTGGSTLSTILKKGLRAQHVDTWDLHALDPAGENPIFCIIEDYLDWVRLKDASWQTARRNMILEGHVWGVEGLLAEPREFIRVTMIRDPFRTFLSNYSYAIKENTEDPLPIETYYERNYGTNSFTRFFGEGDLEAAKSNLENAYDFFGLVEKYIETATMASRYFGYPLEPYIVQNKSDSEKTPISETFLERFRAENDDDLRLYDFTVRLFDQRYAALVGEAPPEAERLETTSTTESYRHAVRDNHDRLLACIAQNRHSEAVILLEENLKKSEAGEIYYHLGEVLALGRCYAKLSNIDKAKEVYMSTMTKRPAHAMSVVIEFLKEHDPETALVVLREAQAIIQGVVYDSPTNSYSINEYVRVSLMMAAVLDKSKLHLAAGVACESALQTLNGLLGVKSEDSLRAHQYSRLLSHTRQCYERLRFAAPREDLFKRWGKETVMRRLQGEAKIEDLIQHNGLEGASELIASIEVEARLDGPVSSYFFSILVGFLSTIVGAGSSDMALIETVTERLMALLDVSPNERRVAHMLLHKGLFGQITDLLGRYHFDPEESRSMP